MIEFCKKNGTPEPQFCQHSDGFAIIFSFKDPMNTANILQSDLYNVRLTPCQEEIISILKKNKKLPAIQIFEQLKVKILMRTLQRELNRLRKLGIISSQGNARFSTWSLVI